MKSTSRERFERRVLEVRNGDAVQECAALLSAMAQEGEVITSRDLARLYGGLPVEEWGRALLADIAAYQEVE